jgi:hypothetical protein
MLDMAMGEQQDVAEGSLNELAPSPGFGGDDDDDKYTPADFGKPFRANYLGQNKFEVFCRKPQDPSNVIKLNAEVQKYGLEWDDDFGFWFLDSPGAVYLSWKYGEIPLPKAIDQARNPGHIHDLVVDYLTNSPHAAEIQKIATEYFGFTADGEMNEGVAEGASDIYSIRQMGDIANNLGNGYVLTDESYDDDDGFTKAMYAVYHQEGKDQYRFVDWVNTRSSYRYTQDEFNQAVQQIVDNDSRNNKVSNVTESLDYLEEK